MRVLRLAAPRSLSPPLDLSDGADLSFAPLGIKGLPPLLDALAAPGVRTRVACTIHHSGEMKTYWDQLAPLAREGRLTLLGLSEHVVRAFSKNLELKSYKDDDPMWTTVGRMAFVPVRPQSRLVLCATCGFRSQDRARLLHLSTGLPGRHCRENTGGLQARSLLSQQRRYPR